MITFQSPSFPPSFRFLIAQLPWAAAVVFALGPGAIPALADDPASVEKQWYTTDTRRQARDGIEAVRAPEDPRRSVARRSADARVLTLQTNGTWAVTKEGSFGLHRPTATVIRRSDTGAFTVETGRGIRDRSGTSRFSADMQIVDKLLRQAQAFQYVITEAWGRAEDIEKFNAGDCADKSFWLASKLAQSGFETARVVLGKHPTQSVGHAWVEVEIDGESYLLETTSHDPPLPKDQAGGRYARKFPTVATFDRQRGLTQRR